MLGALQICLYRYTGASQSASAAPCDTHKGDACQSLRDSSGSEREMTLKQVLKRP